MRTVEGSEPLVSLGSWPQLSVSERSLLLELLLHGGTSRTRLARRLGTSKPSVSRATRALIAHGLVVEAQSESRSPRGRPEEMLEVDPDAAHFFGFKITGDTIYAVVTDLAARIVVEEKTALLDTDVEATLAVMEAAVTKLSAGRPGPAGIGIALAGDVVGRGRAQLVQHANFLGWDGVPVADALHRRTGLPVTVVNDVHALTAVHHWFGGLAEHRSLAVVVVGAGIASGLIVNDAPTIGAHGRAGRVGHHRLGGLGKRCPNGHDDCIHSFVTIPAVEHNARVASGEYGSVVARARDGDRTARAAFRMASSALGAAVAEVVNVSDPESVALMGEGLHMFDLEPAAFHSSLAEYLEQVDPASVRIDRPPFRFSMYARGAAVAIMRELFDGDDGGGGQSL